MGKKEALRQELVSQMTDALLRDETLIIGAACEISYSGRAEAILPAGERIIIIKADKTLLIHQPYGSAPVNYMKERSVHQIVDDAGQLSIKSQNDVFKEYLDILLTDIHFVQAAKLHDGQKLQLTGNEKDMAGMIAKNPSLVEEGLVLVSREEQTKYGFIDVLCHDKQGSFVVIECKRYKADFQAVSQLRRYVERMKKTRGIERVRGILAAPSITANAAKMLHDFGFSFSAVEPPKYKERLKKSQKRLGDF